MALLDSELSELSELIRLILFCFVLVYIIGGTIFTLWSLYLLNGLSGLAVIQKRYSSITTLVVILSLILIIIVLFSSAILITFEIKNEILEILFIIFSILNTICFDGILYLICLRFWLMYFDVKYTISILEGEWIAFLDPNTTSNNWYFSHKNKYGNVVWLAKRLILIYFVSISIEITINVLLIIWNSNDNNNDNGLINIILHFIPISINVYIYSKTPTFYDHYYMRDEMNAINIVFITYLSTQIVYYCFTLIFINNINPDQDQDIFYYIEILYIIIKITLICSLCFICSGWIVSIITSEYGSYNEAKNCSLHPIQQSQNHPAKFKFIFISQQQSSYKLYQPSINNIKYNNNNNNNNNINDDDDIRMPVLMHRNIDIDKNIEISKKLKLPQILSANESFTLFMQHLSRESFMACLLSFVEYYQFKQLLKDNLININVGTFGNAKLAPSIPRSIIVHTSLSHLSGDDGDDDGDGVTDNQLKLLKEYKCRAYMLYNKYIKDGAELPIRLPSDYKQKLHFQMDELDNFLCNSKIDSDQLFHIFDDVILSQYQIMWKSYQRFVKTGDYQLVENLFKQQ